MFWVPSIAISGLTFYSGDKFPEWKGNAFVGSMMQGRMRLDGPRGASVFSPENGQRSIASRSRRAQTADSRCAPRPDGLLYVLTDRTRLLLRIEPEK